MSGVKVTRIATAGQELAGGSTLDASYSGTDVDVTTGLPIDGLLDVDTTGKADQDVLTWDLGTSTWIAQAGASGSVATDAIWDAKGDLAIGTNANAAARLAVGSNNYVLTADSAQPLGVKWAAPSNSGISDQGAFTYFDATEGAAPGTPASGYARIYAKSDGRIYSKTDGGVEYGPFDAAGAGLPIDPATDLISPNSALFGYSEQLNGSTSLTADLIHYYPFVPPDDMTAKRLFYITGGTATGSANLDLGIYSAAGTRLVSTGSTAYATGSASTMISVDIADTALTGGTLYYMAMVVSTQTGTCNVYRANVGTRGMFQYGGLTEASTFPLPATATFALPGSSATIPLCGVHARSEVT